MQVQGQVLTLQAIVDTIEQWGATLLSRRSKAPPSAVDLAIETIEIGDHRWKNGVYDAQPSPVGSANASPPSAANVRTSFSWHQTTYSRNITLLSGHVNTHRTKPCYNVDIKTRIAHSDPGDGELGGAFEY
jgi:hypothetical protein